MKESKIESYEYGIPRSNLFHDFDLNTACDFMSQINDAEAIRLGFAGGEEGMRDAVTREYMLTESANVLPTFLRHVNL